MDESTLAALTEITVRIPADLARRLGTGGEVERRVLEALALDEFRQGHLGRAELRRLLGFATRAKLDEFLTAHGVTGAVLLAAVQREPEKAPEKFKKFLAQGIEVANGTNKWK